MSYEKDAISLRERLKENGFLYFLVGCARNVIHHGNLFLHSLGFVFTNKSDGDGMPIPPPRLRFRVHGELQTNSYLAAGRQIFRDTSRILESQRVEMSRELKVLDFGCGCSRILGHFFRQNSKGTFTGTDIDGDAIAWARANYSGKAKWDINRSRPPLPYPSQTFDVILAISVFTHFDEDLQFDWLRELDRILSVNGILICSVHGRPVWEQSALFNENLRNSMSGKGFHFLQSSLGIRNLAGLPNYYQTAFHSEEFVRNRWGSLFDVIDYNDGAIGNHQTAVVLRKKEFSWRKNGIP